MLSTVYRPMCRGYIAVSLDLCVIIVTYPFAFGCHWQHRVVSEVCLHEYCVCLSTASDWDWTSKKLGIWVSSAHHSEILNYIRSWPNISIGTVPQVRTELLFSLQAEYITILVMLIIFDPGRIYRLVLYHRFELNFYFLLGRVYYNFGYAVKYSRGRSC
jgi:hypothetical protein